MAQRRTYLRRFEALCALSDGNLSRHLQVLIEAKLIEMSKGFENNRPQTRCAMTTLGRKRYLEYVQVLEQVLQDATAASGEHRQPLHTRPVPV